MMMMDFEWPKNLAPLVSSYLRPIVFSFLAIQIAAGCVFVWWCRRRWGVACAALRDSVATAPPYWKGLRLRPRGPLDMVCLLGFLVLLGVYAWLIINRADLSYPDQSHITAGAMQGQLWMQMQPGNGRLSPMLHQEFLVISLFLHSAVGYYLLAAGLLVAVCAGMLGTLDVPSLAVRLALVASLIVSSAFAIPVSGLIFPEINILLALMVFMGFASREARVRVSGGGKGSLTAAAGMIAVAVYLIYLKEPFFAVFAAYALLAMLADREGWTRCRARDGKGFLGEALARWAPQLAILGLASVYAVVYFFYAFLQTRSRYGGDQSSGMAEVFLASLQSSPWVAVYGIVLVVRAALIKRKVCKYDPVVDPLAYAFVFYYTILLMLGLVYSYYYLPVAFMAVVLVAQTATPFAGRKSIAAGLMVMSLCFVLLGVQPALGWFAHRDLYMQSRALMADALVRALEEQSPAGETDVYFLERVQGYELGQFLSYLNYRHPDRTFVAEGKIPPAGPGGAVTGMAAFPVSQLDKSGATMKAIRQTMTDRGSDAGSACILVAPPEQSGRNIQFDQAALAQAAAEGVRVVEVLARFEPMKRWLFGFFGVDGSAETSGYLVVFPARERS